MQVFLGTIPGTNRSVKDLIKVILIDIDNTLLSFTGYVKEAMREGFSYFGLKPYTEDMFPVFERINNSLWRQLEQGALTFEELIDCRWDLVFKELDIHYAQQAMVHTISR